MADQSPMRRWILTHVSRAWTALFTLAGLGAAFVYKPELLTLYLRTTMTAIETGTAALPYPWGDRAEVVLRGIGGSIWMQLAFAIIVCTENHIRVYQVTESAKLALNVVDGCMPSDLGAGTTAELEEERRLLYVAMTRAKDNLHLVVPQRFFTHGQHAQGDRHVYASRTRFIPDRLLGLFEKTIWPLAVASAAARPASQGPRIDVGARMRGMWR
jgi:hypothetical protein